MFSWDIDGNNTNLQVEKVVPSKLALKAKSSSKAPNVTPDADRRVLATRRLAARRRVKPSEALLNASTPAEVLRALQRKAEEYIAALSLEARLPGRVDLIRTLELALFQDFIEVHNASASRVLKLPEARDDVDKLIA